MPRTKINKKAAIKRNRKNSTDERTEMKLREFDTIADAYFNELEYDYQCFIDGLSDDIKRIKSQLPARIRGLTLREMRENKIQTFADCQQTMNATMGTSESNFSSSETTDAAAARHSKKKSSHDEGYLTEEGRGSRSVENQLQVPLMTAGGRPLGPLASAQAGRPLRRSRSAIGLASAAKGTIKKGGGGAKSLASLASSSSIPAPHTSRSKYRTPMNRVGQSASADRVLGFITPKVQPNMPMAILRRARYGEHVFSVSGSPVITSNVTEEIANVNIPVQDGILSIRPTEMQSVDPKIVNKIDSATIAHLKQLQANLNKIMAAANSKMTS